MKSQIITCDYCGTKKTYQNDSQLFGSWYKHIRIQHSNEEGGQTIVTEHDSCSCCDKLFSDWQQEISSNKPIDKVLGNTSPELPDSLPFTVQTNPEGTMKILDARGDVVISCKQIYKRTPPHLKTLQRNFDFIVMACNAYPELLEIVESVASLYAPSSPWAKYEKYFNLDQLIPNARSLLRKLNS